MSVADVLRRIVAHLDAAGIPHMVAGSFASTYHGVPRATQDVDIVIEATRSTLDAFLASLSESEYYIDADAARDALRDGSMVNAVDLATGWKIDLVMRKARPFSVEAFRRRTPANLFEVNVFVSTAEDAIVAKLEWAKLADSERQLRDVAGILSVRAGTLDLDYIDEWVAALGLAAEWARVTPRGSP